jgi:argininosuccinate lyase
VTAEGMLWEGRFESGPHADMLRLTRSTDIDIRLLAEDIAVTKAHAGALKAAGLIGADDARRLAAACDELLRAYREEGRVPVGEDEDVHTFVERELTEALGELGARIHAGRSRNDLVATDLRLWCKRQAIHLTSATRALVGALADRAEQHADWIMPGYTHLQRAQPVTVGFHLAAHGFALGRDVVRFERAAEAADESALGAGALAGTTLPIDPSIAATELGFTRVFQNAMDAVSDRDFAFDLLYAAALCAVHLSRLAEEIVIWTSHEFAFARLPDEWSTGSSMMPQKRNPDLAELIRGRCAPQIGDLTSLLTLLKSTPLAYVRDLQEDKSLVFSAVDRIAGSIEGMTRLVESLSFDRPRMESAAAQAATWATDLAEVLVTRGVPFRQAHEAVGRLVTRLESVGSDLAAASTEDLAVHPQLRDEDRRLADPRRSVGARAAPGATAPERVLEQVKRLRAL